MNKGVINFGVQVGIRVEDKGFFRSGGNRQRLQEGGVGMTQVNRAPYEKPVLTRHENIKDVTFECPAWQCSVTVPPPPLPPAT